MYVLNTKQKYSYVNNEEWQKQKYLKSSRNKKDLNYVTAARFSVSFSQLPAAKKHQKAGSCEVIKVPLILQRLQQINLLRMDPIFLGYNSIKKSYNLRYLDMKFPNRSNISPQHGHIFHECRTMGAARMIFFNRIVDQKWTQIVNTKYHAQHNSTS